MNAEWSTFLRFGLIAGGIIVLISLLLGVHTFSRLAGWISERKTPQVLSELISPAYRITRPDGEGPFPTALLLSGCDGPYDNLETWANALKAAGWASVVVDSHGPRGYDNAQIWRLICAGQLLPGAERAGDLATALTDVRAMSFVDPEALALIGASHGGWTILDLMALESHNRVPFNLTRWPEGSGAATLAGVKAAVLLYPYCGTGSMVSRWGWTAEIPTLFLLVEDDAIADETDCMDLVTEMEAAGRPVQSHLFSGVTHGFDQKERSQLSLLEYDDEATQAALHMGIEFLQSSVQR